jgi:hypothetical protein
MSYESAPATQMLATHCAVCARPLLDAKSVELGIGPDCRRKHGFSTAEVEPNWSEVADALRGYAVAQLPQDAEVADALWRLGGIETRRVANALVHRIALAQSAWQRGEDDAQALVAASVRAIRALGFVKLASICETRLRTVEMHVEDGALAVIAPYHDTFLVRSRSIPGRRWEGAKSRTLFAPTVLRAVLDAVIAAWGSEAMVVVEGRMTTAREARDAAPEDVMPSAPSTPTSTIDIVAEGNRYVVRAPYVAAATDAWRTIPGRRWDAARRANTVPVVARDALVALLATHYREAALRWLSK